MTTYLGKSCSFCLPRVPFVNCRQFMYLVISLFGFEGWIWDLIVSVPDHCLSFYFPLAFIAGWLQGHWWGFISRNYVVLPTFLLINVFIALKGSYFWFLFSFFLLRFYWKLIFFSSQFRILIYRIAVLMHWYVRSTSHGPNNLYVYEPQQNN